MRRPVLAVMISCSFACSPDASPQLPAAGEPCDAEGQCAEGLDCVRLVCADDTGPGVDVLLPAHMSVFSGELEILGLYLSVDSDNADDQVEIVVDLGGSPQVEVFAVADLWMTVNMFLATPLAPGPHHVRARVLDADGQPYANPSATMEVVLFVRDPDIPNTPQVAVVWPPSGYEHRIGNPLEVEVAVLPGSFTFADGESCEPVPDCEPELAPECEDWCGPVTRYGHAKLYIRPDYPGCLLDEPISCFGDYIGSLRAPGAALIDGHQARDTIPAELLGDEPGSVPLTVALNFSSHAAYPSAANIIFETIELQLVE
jgi:hypothetical protein